jgi:type I restriction enzyme M protein
MARGFEGVVEGWVMTILTALEDEDGKSKFDPHEPQAREELMPEYLDEIAEAEARVAELQGTLQAADGSG